MSIRFIIVLFYIFFLFACSGAKYYVNQAEKFEKSRDYEQAVVHYNEAINRDPENKDAIPASPIATEFLRSTPK